LPAPLHHPFGSIEQQLRTAGESVVEVRQGQHLDSPLDPVGSGHQSDTGAHRGGLARSTNTRLRSRSEATRTSVRRASMFLPAFPMKRPTSVSASLTLMATVPPPRSKDSTWTSSGFSARDFATYSTSAR